MHYLSALYPVIERLEKIYDFEFHVISNEKPTKKLTSLVYKKWNKSTEIEDLSLFQIGLMPLEDTEWSAGKCGFKALQYMSLGAVAVVSPVGVNSKIIDNGKNGFIANGAEEWYTTLAQLIANEQERKNIGQAAIESIEQQWSVQHWAEKYVQLFKK